MTDRSPNRIDLACLTVLIVLQILMLAALYTGTEPHPPLAVAPFALGPFLSASIAIAAAALMLGAGQGGAGPAAVLAAVVTALVSFGPQKWFDAAFFQIWPAVILAQIACAILAWRAVAGILARQAAPAA